jgi:UDP-N-acetyl-D-mannosaminuronate dehydrogenase
MTKIMNMSQTEIIDSIQSGQLNVCVIGVGRIGLPTAISFANSGIVTIGVDINSKR